MSLWQQEFEKVQGALIEIGQDFRCASPASENEIKETEKRRDMEFPPSLRRFFLSFSKDVVWRWSIERDASSPFPQIFSGGFALGLPGIEPAEDSRKDWIESCFSNIENKYDAVWHNKLVFICAPNGDQIAFDLSPENFERIIYLCHDGCGYHGYVMADNLDDLMSRWLPLGCPGPEGWQWLCFTESSTSRIISGGENGRKWRRFLGLESGVQNQGGV